MRYIRHICEMRLLTQILNLSQSQVFDCFSRRFDKKSYFIWNCRINLLFVSFFLHLFILQAIYIVLQDLKMKMLFVE